jgi:hypothetical protein
MTPIKQQKVWSKIVLFHILRFVKTNCEELFEHAMGGSLVQKNNNKLLGVTVVC